MSEIILPQQITESDNIPLEVIADMLHVDVEELYDLTLEQISALTIEAANEKSRIINETLEKRDVAHDVIVSAQKEYGITQEDLSYIYFEELKK